MTDSQLFLMMGIIYAAAGMGMLINPDYYRKIADSFENSPGLTYVTCIALVVGGFVLVAFHNIWTGWPLVITLFGWVVLLKGIVLLVFPAQLMKLSKWLVIKLGRLRLYAVVTLLIGLGLIYISYRC